MARIFAPCWGRVDLEFFFFGSFSSIFAYDIMEVTFHFPELFCKIQEISKVRILLVLVPLDAAILQSFVVLFLKNEILKRVKQ